MDTYDIRICQIIVANKNKETIVRVQRYCKILFIRQISFYNRNDGHIKRHHTHFVRIFGRPFVQLREIRRLVLSRFPANVLYYATDIGF